MAYKRLKRQGPPELFSATITFMPHSRSRLDHLLRRMAKTRVVVIGDLILDEFIWGSV
jgi:hypothetical protein